MRKTHTIQTLKKKPTLVFNLSNFMLKTGHIDASMFEGTMVILAPDEATMLYDTLGNYLEAFEERNLPLIKSRRVVGTVVSTNLRPDLIIDEEEML